MMTMIEKVQKINKTLNTSSPSLESFEETYKTAYSHGLENIYSLETVDLKTVKRLQNHQVEPMVSPDEERVVLLEKPHFEEQLDLELGDSFRGWVEPLFLMEPIQVLGLAQTTERYLFQHNKIRLKDLIEQDLREYIFLDGIEQRYVDEIQSKLLAYIGNRSLERSFTIEFGSWLRSLIVGLERIKAAVLFQTFGLEEVVPLSTTERVRIKKVDSKTKQQWMEQILRELQQVERSASVHKNMQRFVQTFILPWMLGRNGLAMKNELMERLQKVSDTYELTTNAMHFFSEVYYEGKFPLTKYLFLADKELFYCDISMQKAYHEISSKAMSYFYKPSLHYLFDQLVVFIVTELVQEWKEVKVGFIEATLRRSPKFRVCKGGSGALEIRLN